MSEVTELDRDWAAKTLVDGCTIYRESDTAPTWSEALGRTVYGTDDVVYQGPCSVSFGVSDRRVTEGSDPTVLAEWVVRVPLDALGIASGDVVHIDSVHPGGDGALAGQDLTVRRVGMRTSAALRRLFCEIQTRTAP